MITSVRRALSGPAAQARLEATETVDESTLESAPLAHWSRPRRVGLLAAGAVIPLVLAFHFGMTALHEMPFNPLKEKYGEEVNAYMLPHFGQDWHLFAPDPVDRDKGVLVRAQKRQPDGSTVTTEWVDVTSPGLLKLYGERFWPSREFRVGSGLPQLLESWPNPELEKMRSKNQGAREPGNEEQEKNRKEDPPLTPDEKDARDQAALFAQSFASAEAGKLWGPDLEYVQVRIATNEFPRFSQRYSRDAKGKISYYDLDWARPVRVEQ
ncbi:MULTISPECIES: DUF5819 family protein [unclassified Streptomyces]|uniref:DUF5819 family protein n=1 Tax=unclassified Streptomyces TaxID=2593676 RepID=UPI003805A6CC